MLRQVGDDHYAFAHLTLQEYLAAWQLAKRDNGDTCERIFCRAYFNMMLAEMEALPMTLGLVGEPDKFYETLEHLPESLTFAGLRLRARGLAYTSLNTQTLARMTDRLIECIVGERIEERNYFNVVCRSYAAASEQELEFIVGHVGKLLISKKGYGVKERAAEVLGRIGSERAVDNLLAALKENTRFAGWSAARSLGRIGGKKALSGLLKVLKEGDSEVRGFAAEALGEIGDQKAIVGLLNALVDENKSLRDKAANSLARIGGEQVISGLLVALRHKDDDVRWRAAKVLGKIGANKAVEELVKALRDSNRDVRVSVADALGQIADSSAITGLLDTIKDESGLVRKSVAIALGRVGGSLAVAGLMDLLNDKHWTVRWSALEALGETGEVVAVKELLNTLKIDDHSLRRRAASSLAKIGGEQAVAGLLDALSDKDEIVRGFAAEALSKIGGEQVVTGLRGALAHADSGVRELAVKVLGRVGGPRALTGLQGALRDKSIAVRKRASEELGERSGEQMLDLWIKDLEYEPPPNFVSYGRERSATAVGKIGGERAVVALLGALNDNEWGVRHNAITALGNALSKMSFESVANSLLLALLHHKNFVRRLAAEYIGYYAGNNEVKQRLSYLGTTDPSEDVRHASSKALPRVERKLQYFDAFTTNDHLQPSPLPPFTT